MPGLLVVLLMQNFAPADLSKQNQIPPKIAITQGQNSKESNFKKLWYDGNAEISTYTLLESRYGQIRNGKRVMVWVTEPLRLNTLIKPDKKLAESEMIRVLKLNDLRKFSTGIYEYSVMTSLFSAVENKGLLKNNETVKISFTAQEWCGQVFDRLINKDSAFTGHIYSYFETDAEKKYTLPSQNIETEENLWMRIRELNSVYLLPGNSLELSILPSRWMERKAHGAPQVHKGVISNEGVSQLNTVLGKIFVKKYVWQLNGQPGKTTVWVEEKYPHRIVQFTERDGSSGKLLASRREPYWTQNSTKFDFKRKELGLVE